MTRPIKTILGATDLSRPAFDAVRRAGLIARDHDATLDLLHVIPESFGSVLWNEVRATLSPAEIDLRKSIDESLDALVLQLDSETGVRAKAHVSQGKPFAAKCNRNTVSRLRGAVRGETDANRPWADTRAEPLDCGTARAHSAHSFVDAHMNDARRMIRHGPPALRVREYAKEVGADLIVTGSEEVPRYQTALLGSVSLDLVTESECDVLFARTTPSPATTD